MKYTPVDGFPYYLDFVKDINYQILLTKGIFNKNFDRNTWVKLKGLGTKSKL